MKLTEGTSLTISFNKVIALNVPGTHDDRITQRLVVNIGCQVVVLSSNTGKYNVANK